MGLDALVYKSKKHLPFDAEALAAAHDADTGEYYFERVAHLCGFDCAKVG